MMWCWIVFYSEDGVVCRKLWGFCIGVVLCCIVVWVCWLVWSCCVLLCVVCVVVVWRLWWVYSWLWLVWRWLGVSWVVWWWVLCVMFFGDFGVMVNVWVWLSVMWYFDSDECGYDLIFCFSSVCNGEGMICCLGVVMFGFVWCIFV